MRRVAVPISSYALLSDSQGAALVSRDGSIDWACMPRFDAPSTFAGLLDPDAGHWSLRPAASFDVERSYVDGTLVLRTVFTSEAGAIAHMDKHNIDTSILSISSPSVGFLNDAPARQRLAREVNVFAADLTQRNPQRFGAFGTLPLPDIQSSLAEIAYALDHLRLDGVVMETNVHGIYLGDQRLDPIFSELNRRKATLFLHPTSPACFEAVGLGRPAPILEFPMDTARTVTDLIFAGTLTRYPDIRMIIPHAGGALTAVADRIASFSSLPFLAQRPAGGAAEVRKVLASLYYDLAGSARDSMIDGLRHLTSLTHILFGSDYPFTPEEGINANVEAFRTLSSLKNVEHEAIARKNALALFPRLRAI